MINLGNGSVFILSFEIVMGRATVLDRGPPGPRAFWEDRDRPKTDPLRPKDQRAFLVLKLADF